MQPLTQYFSQESIEAGMIPYEQYHPYPQAAERGFWEKRSELVREYYISQGEKFLSFLWKSVDATSFLNFYRTGDRTENETQNFSKRKALGALILAECFEYQGRFLDAIINGIWSVCEETVWSIGAHLKFGGQRDLLPDPELGQPLDLFSLETAHLIAFADYMLGDALDQVSPAVRRRIKKELYQRTIRPFVSRSDYWWMGFLEGYRPLNNWNPWCTCNALWVVLLCCEEKDLRKKGIWKAVQCLSVYLDDAPQDGSCDEGTSYWVQAGFRAIETVDLLCGSVKCDRSILQSQKLLNMARFMVHNHIDREWYVNFADGSAKMNTTIPCGMLYLSRVLQDRTLESEAAGLFEQNKGLETAQSGYDPGRVMLNVMYYDQLSQIRAKPVLQKTVWYPQTQVMLCRETEEYGKGLFLAAKGGHNGESHNHNDIGTFIVFRDGTPVLIDIGVGTYTRQTFGPERYSIWTMRSLYHNLPLFQGIEQRPGKEFCAREAVFSSVEFQDCFSMDLSAAYGLEAGTVFREFLFDRKGREIRVTDRLRQKQPCQWTLMTAQRPELGEGEFWAGGCRVEVEHGTLSVEPIPLTDEKLSRVWGDTCYRVLVTGETDVQTIRVYA